MAFVFCTFGGILWPAYARKKWASSLFIPWLHSFAPFFNWFCLCAYIFVEQMLIEEPWSCPNEYVIVSPHEGNVLWYARRESACLTDAEAATHVHADASRRKGMVCRPFFSSCLSCYSWSLPLPPSLVHQITTLSVHTRWVHNELWGLASSGLGTVIWFFYPNRNTNVRNVILERVLWQGKHLRCWRWREKGILSKSSQGRSAWLCHAVIERRKRCQSLRVCFCFVYLFSCFHIMALFFTIILHL